MARAARRAGGCDRLRSEGMLQQGMIELQQGMIELAAGPASEAASPPEPDEAFPREASTQPLRRSKWLGSSSAPAPGASLAAGTLNLLNTIVGGGILALPFAFRSCGLLTGVLYQLVFGAMSWYGCYLLLDCLQHAKTATSFEALAQAEALAS